MDAIFDDSSFQAQIRTVEMHTTGEPTRIVYEGYPELRGTLLEQRAQAKKDHDHIRRRLMYEPRGHYDMYGAVLRPHTELTESGDAHIGVLFMTNDGYSTMCGHATIALGRFLIDMSEQLSAMFPHRTRIRRDSNKKTALLKLHAPCGLLEVTVPTNNLGTKSDPTRPVSFKSVPSFATGFNVNIPISDAFSWPELGRRSSVTVDFSYGGAFYCMIQAKELGFPDGLKQPDITAMDLASKQLKAAINGNPELRHLFQHPEHDDLSFLYSVMIVDKQVGVAQQDTKGGETGLCFFADQQIDRSPTGSAVQARVALAVAKHELPMADRWTYHSLVSNSWNGKGAFIGSAVEIMGRHHDFPIIKVCVEGFASYTGHSTFFVEVTDPLGDGGFLFGKA